MKLGIAECVKTYAEQGLDGSKPNSNDKLYWITITFFKKGDKVYYKKDDDIYFISEEEKYLSDMTRYNTDIVEMKEETFKEHFSEIM